MFAEKVCEQVVGFSAMAEDEMFDVNGGYQADAAAGTMGGSNGGAASPSTSKPSVKETVADWAINTGSNLQTAGTAISILPGLPGKYGEACVKTGSIMVTAGTVVKNW